MIFNIVQYTILHATHCSNRFGSVVAAVCFCCGVVERSRSPKSLMPVFVGSLEGCGGGGGGGGGV